MQSMRWHFRSGLCGFRKLLAPGEIRHGIYRSRVEAGQLMQEQSALHFESGEEEESNALRVPEKTSRGEEPVLKQVADLKVEWKASKQRERNRSRFVQTGVWLKTTEADR